MTEPGKGEQVSFFKTLPGILTGVAAVITAIVGLITALNAAGVIGDGSGVSTTIPQPAPSLATTQAESTQTEDTERIGAPQSVESTGPTTAPFGLITAGDNQLPEGPSTPVPTIVRTIDVETEFILGLAAGQDALWVTTDENALIRIDPANGETVGSVPVGRFPLEVAVSAGAVWVANTEDGTVTRVDPVTLVVTDTFVVGSWPSSLAIGAGAVWTDGGESVWRIDVETGEVTNIDVGVGTFCVAVGAEAVWACAPDQRSVLRLDPATLTVTDTITVGSFPREIAVGHEAVWVADEGGDLVRIDLRDLDVRQIAVSEFPQMVTADRETVWVLGTTLDRVDPGSLLVTRIPVDGGQDLAVGLGAVWLVGSDGDSVIVLQ